MNLRIAIVTCESLGDYNNNAESEDIMLANLFIDQGLDFKFEIWSDDQVDWAKYTHLLVKSPWDYFDRYEEFRQWCGKIKALGIPVLNDLDTILWNSDKKYLKEVEAKGHRIIPTQFLAKGGTLAPEEAFKEFDTDLLIFKPSVSGGAKNTLKLKKGQLDGAQEQVMELLEAEDFLLQPFVPEIMSEGEYSLVFFNGKFSHAVLKSPKAGDFRVQHFFGGKISSIHPSADMLKAAQGIIDDFAKDCLYGRVDGVLIDGEFFLMELELIEPYLFWFTSATAKDNYMKALLDRIG